MTDELNLAGELRESLRPLFRKLNNARTMSLGKSGILAHLAEGGRTTASELAVSLQISPQGVTAALQELANHGLVDRTPDDADRRRIWVHLTEEGRRRLADDREAGQRWLSEAIDTRLDDVERRALLAAVPALRKLTAEPTDA